MPMLTINGTSYAYEEAGEGRPLLLIHAGITDRRMWDDVWRAMAARHRAIRFDLRGYGETPMPDGTFNWTSDTAALLAGLDVSRADVVGVSIGAAVALDLALARPEVVDRLVLVAAGLTGWDYSDAMGRYDEDERSTLDRGDFDAASWHTVRFWVDGPHRSPEEVDDRIRQRVFEMQHLAYEIDNPTAELEWLVPDRAERLGEVQAPTLLVVGELDQPDYGEIGKHMARVIPNARLEVMSGVAHLPPMEAPAEFTRLVLDFLSD